MNCKNCELQLQTHHNYCPDCGAKVIRNRLTIKALFSHFTEQFLNYDNKFIQTFINLFKRPEDVIGNYLKGTRKKYVNVISYFSIAIMITGIEYLIINRFFPSGFTLSNMPTKEVAEAGNKAIAMVQEYQSFVMMLFVPFYALLGKIVFLNIKKYNYTEHLVIFMYILAQMSIVGSLIVIPAMAFGFNVGEIGYIILILQMIYTAFCLKSLYGLSFKGIVLRTLLFILVFLVFYILLIILVIVYGIVLDPEWIRNLREAQGATG